MYEEYQVRVYNNGTVEWRQNGYFHRLNGPAAVHPDGTIKWYQNGVLHRLNGPAVEDVFGNKYYYQHNDLHRTDGPAVEGADGHKEWHQYGKLHRLDGPAIQWPAGSSEWFIEDIQYTEEEFNKKISDLNSEETSLTNEDIKVLRDLARAYMILREKVEPPLGSIVRLDGNVCLENLQSFPNMTPNVLSLLTDD